MLCMFTLSSPRRLVIALGLLIVLVAGWTPTAQGQSGGIIQRDDPRFVTLDDFLHFVLIDRVDVAEAKGRELIGMEIDPRAFVALVEELETQRRGRDFEEVAQRARRRPELESVADELLDLYDRGRLAEARNADEIAKNIGLLTGHLQARVLARERLKAAGEYAMPQLLEALVQRRDGRLSAAVEQLMIDMRRQAVMPLSEALLGVPEADQARLARILGQIPYQASVPFLLELAASTEDAGVRAAVNEALEVLGGATDTGVAFADLAERYYAESDDLTSFPGESHQLLWTHETGVGLVATPIATEVFHEAMVMSLVERGIGLGNSSAEALALWVSANFGREIDQPRGYRNPAYASDRREALYYAVASGSDVGNRVLGRAIGDRDTALALRALTALSRTAGPSLVAGGSPVVDALTYPDRRVQYEAALVLAASGPDSPFSGAQRVVPTLASAIRFADEKYALVLATDEESYQGVRGSLEGDGYTVLPYGRTLSDVASPLSEAPGIDLVVLWGPSAGMSAAIGEVRGDPRLSAAPLLGLTGSSAVFDLRRRYAEDVAVAFRPQGLTPETLVSAASEVVSAASGGELDAAQAQSYTKRSLAALRDLALVGSRVLDVMDAARPMVQAVREHQGEDRLAVARVLELIPDSSAQRALVESALNATGRERVELLMSAAASGRRHGNMLEPRHAESLVDLARTGGTEEATAAASVIGALGLPGADLVELIGTGD